MIAECIDGGIYQGWAREYSRTESYSKFMDIIGHNYHNRTKLFRINDLNMVRVTKPSSRCYDYYSLKNEKYHCKFCDAPYLKHVTRILAFKHKKIFSLVDRMVF